MQYPWVIYSQVWMGSNETMDKYEARRLALRKLIDAKGRGGIAEVATRIGKPDNYVSRMLYPAGKPGRKRIGEDTLDDLVAAYPAAFSAFTRSSSRMVASTETESGYVAYQQMEAEGGAGPGVENPDYPEVLREVKLAEWQVREKLGRVHSPKRVKLLTVRGDSMTPRIRHGDVVFVDLEDRQPEDGCLFAIVLHGLTLVKRLEFRTDGVHIVSLAAPDRPDIVAPDDISSLHIAGRVLGAIQLRKAEDL